MKHLLALTILLIISLLYPSVFAQETVMQCALEAQGCSALGLVLHGSLTLCVFVLFLKWASRAREGFIAAETESTFMEEGFKEAA